MSSRFDSPHQLETALRKTAPDTEAFLNGVPNPGNPNRMTVTHQLPSAITYGSGVSPGGSNLVPLKSVKVK